MNRRSGNRTPVLASASLGVLCILLQGCWTGCAERRIPDAPPKTAPDQADLMEFHRLRALALDSLIVAHTADWDSVGSTGTGIRYEILERKSAAPVSSLPKGTVLELHHRFALLDGKTITTWQEDGPMAFELEGTDLPAGFHQLIGQSMLGDSLRALIPPSQAWGMSGRPPEIPQEAVIAVAIRIDLYTRPA